METVFANWRAIDLTENHTRQLHLELLEHSEKDARHRGNYKTLPNHVEAFDSEGRRIGVVFETATPFETPFRMAELVDWTRARLDGNALHALLAIGVFVATFLAIHPFQDGNGRLSRALTTLLLLRAGYEYVPYSSLESVIENTRDAYYLALRRTQATIGTDAPDWEPWLDYFLTALRQQKDRLRRRIDRERIVLGDLPELSIRILDIARDTGRVSVADAVRATAASRDTIKGHVQALVAAGHLRRHGAGRGGPGIRSARSLRRRSFAPAKLPTRPLGRASASPRETAGTGLPHRRTRTIVQEAPAMESPILDPTAIPSP